MVFSFTPVACVPERMLGPVTYLAPSDSSLDSPCLLMSAASPPWPGLLTKILAFDLVLYCQHVFDHCLCLIWTLIFILHLFAWLLPISAYDLTSYFCSSDLSTSTFNFAELTSWNLNPFAALEVPVSTTRGACMGIVQGALFPSARKQ